MYRSLLITRVDDSVSAVTDLGAGLAVGAALAGGAGLAGFTGLPPHLPV